MPAGLPRCADTAQTPVVADPRSPLPRCSAGSSAAASIPADAWDASLPDRRSRKPVADCGDVPAWPRRWLDPPAPHPVPGRPGPRRGGPGWCSATTGCWRRSAPAAWASSSAPSTTSCARRWRSRRSSSSGGEEPAGAGPVLPRSPGGHPAEAPEHRRRHRRRGGAGRRAGRPAGARTW